MPLTWASLEDSILPLNLLNFPAWQFPLEKKLEKKMLVELTEEEVEAFKVMCDDNDLYAYVSYGKDGSVTQDAYATLLTKLGIDLTGEQDVSA
jgi:hypothetical protein